MHETREFILSLLDLQGDLAVCELLRRAGRESGRDLSDLKQALRGLVSEGLVGFTSRNGQTVASRFARTRSVVAEGIALCSEHDDIANFSGVVVKLADGPAFGGGEHPTTRLCLSALSRLLAPEGGLAQELREKALDAGCGTGVLSVVAALLGVSLVVAADIDPWAPFATRINAERNNVASAITVVDADAARAARDHGPFGLILANLRLPTLLGLMAGFAESLRPGGAIVCSGFTEEEAPALKKEARARRLAPLFGGTGRRWAMETFSREAA
ncbi:MAG: 50S ribosomal protein L11 methyltransferase [Thermodesulfobacteriota bacterium]